MSSAPMRQLICPVPLSTSPSCGIPDYRLYCNNKVLQLKSANRTLYKVLSFDPSSDSFIISAPSISPGSCMSSDIMDGGLQIDDRSPFNISNRNMVLLFNCSQSLLLFPFHCSSNSVCRKFERVDEGIKCRKTLCCGYLKYAPSMSQRIRIRVGACTADTSVVAIDENAEPGLRKVGIELQWLPVLA